MSCKGCGKDDRPLIEGVCWPCASTVGPMVDGTLAWREMLARAAAAGFGAMADGFDEWAAGYWRDVLFERRDPLQLDPARRLTFDQPTPRAQAQFLAREIQSDGMAREDEVAEAIEHAIWLFANVNAGPVKGALATFGRCLPSCGWWDTRPAGTAAVCTCGFQLALKATEAGPERLHGDAELPEDVEALLAGILSSATAARDYALRSPAPRARVAEAATVLFHAQRLRAALVLHSRQETT